MAGMLYLVPTPIGNLGISLSVAGKSWPRQISLQQKTPGSP